MANTISVSNRLRKTCNPVNIASVRRFCDARREGCSKLKAVQEVRAPEGRAGTRPARLAETQRNV
jgi:hypothetical protein